MKLLSDWGITGNWWRGDRGEYWVIAQGILLLIFALLPPNRPSSIDLDSSAGQYFSWTLAAIFSILAIVFLGRSLFDLGQNLTPLPHPRDDGQLVKTGVYGLVRHPLYSGVIYLALAYASWQMSFVHLLGAIVLFVFFDAKSRKEEVWLTEKFSDYANYSTAVKKLIPGIY
ncbi:isoprenylcysteine carboxylmethyltransferase family protein [Chamaesiphon sp. VAR_48_metabat_135_sub]|uniref:methyltransferase family protein n=1 Tax=Chamaesiphon sp. VAR_48_metabat_135_sub TaxID=2964699 RepID=UPI00286D514C|nr:isoprenylcysteine carboxylmethyltransferase family protein [Chamaesiphon sp. VAR_48_metabat_135_sub]